MLYKAIRSAVLLFLSMLVPALGFSMHLLSAGKTFADVLNFWSALPALVFLSLFLLGLGIPIILSVYLLKNRPERVLLSPASLALILLFLLSIFCKNMVFPHFVSLTALSLSFLLMPFMRSSKRLGEFERVPQELALRGFCLIQASGTTLSLIPLLFIFNDRRHLIGYQGAYLLFLAIAYYGIQWLRRNSR